mgnify:CR=1 FL=1
MKKILLALASLILVCSITACDKQADSSTVEEGLSLIHISEPTRH